MGVSSTVSVLDSLDFTSTLARHMADDTLWAYLALAVTTAPPLVPNAALLVTGGVLAARGRLDIVFVLLVVAGSALAGDLLIHRAGRALSGPVLGRVYRGGRRRQLFDWAADRIQRYGVPFVAGCRFLPSGRLVGGLAAGVVGYPARRYLVGASIAEAIWAAYSVGIGYLGGRATANSLYALGLGLGVSAAVATVGGLVQAVARRKARTAARTPSRTVTRSAAGVPAPGAVGAPEAGPAWPVADRAGQTGP